MKEILYHDVALEHAVTHLNNVLPSIRTIERFLIHHELDLPKFHLNLYIRIWNQSKNFWYYFNLKAGENVLTVSSIAAKNVSMWYPPPPLKVFICFISFKYVFLGIFVVWKADDSGSETDDDAQDSLLGLSSPTEASSKQRTLLVRHKPKCLLLTSSQHYLCF